MEVKILEVINNASVTQRIFEGVKDYWVWLEFYQDNTNNLSLSFIDNSFF